MQCGGGAICVVRTAVCDGRPDCADGSDEDGCTVTCAPGEHQCSDGSACVPAQYRCDAQTDCRDGSDEEVRYPAAVVASQFATVSRGSFSLPHCALIPLFTLIVTIVTIKVQSSFFFRLTLFNGG